jgi:hypothetical protein
MPSALSSQWCDPIIPIMLRWMYLPCLMGLGTVFALWRLNMIRRSVVIIMHNTLYKLLLHLTSLSSDCCCCWGCSNCHWSSCRSNCSMYSNYMHISSKIQDESKMAAAKQCQWMLIAARWAVSCISSWVLVVKGGGEALALVIGWVVGWVVDSVAAALSMGWVAPDVGSDGMGGLDP